MICSLQEQGYEAFVEHPPAQIQGTSHHWFSSTTWNLLALWRTSLHQMHSLLSSIQISCVQSQSHFIVDCDCGVFEKWILQVGVDTAETQSLTCLRAFAALSFKKLYHLNSDNFPFLHMFPFKCFWSVLVPSTAEAENVRTRKSGTFRTGILSTTKDIYFSLLTDAEDCGHEPTSFNAGGKRHEGNCTRIWGENVLFFCVAEQTAYCLEQVFPHNTTVFHYKTYSSVTQFPQMSHQQFQFAWETWLVNTPMGKSIPGALNRLSGHCYAYSHLLFPFSKFHLKVSINWPDFFFHYNDLIYLMFIVLRLLVQ